MAGDPLATLEQLDGRLGHADVDLGARMPAWLRIVMSVDLDVVVDTGPNYLPFGIFVAALR